MPAIYRIIVLGAEGRKLPITLEAEVSRIAQEFGLSIGVDLVIVDGKSAEQEAVASVALFLGEEPAPAFKENWILTSGIPIIPVVSRLKNCSHELPAEIGHLNAMGLSQPDSQ